MQNLELGSPATVLVSQLKADPPADEQPLAHRLDLEEANTRTVQVAIVDKHIRTVSSTFKAIIKEIPPGELVGNALEDVYKAASSVLVFREEGIPTHKPLTLKKVVDLADLTGNFTIEEASKALGKILQAFGLVTADFQPLPTKVTELRNAVVVLLEEQVYMHIQGTQVWNYCIKNLKHMTKLKEVAFAERPIPVDYIWHLLSNLSYTKATLQDKSDTQAYFTLLMQAERLIERMTNQNQSDVSAWGLLDVPSLEKVNSKEDFELLVLKYIEAVVKPEAVPEPDEGTETNTGPQLSIDDLWDTTDSPVTPAKRKAAEDKQAHRKQKAKTTHRPESAPNTNGGLIINDVSVSQMAQHQRHCKNWVSTVDSKVRVKYRFEDEVEDVLGEITSASYSEKTGKASWKVAFNDSRLIELDLDQTAGAVQYYKIWAADQRRRGFDPEVEVVDPPLSNSAPSSRGGPKKRKLSGLVDVKAAMKKLSKEDKKSLDEWCDELDGSMTGSTFVESDEDEEALFDAESNVDHLSIFETVRGENFAVLRDALQFAPSNPKYERVRSCLPVEAKVRRVKEQLRDEMNVVLDHNVMLPLVFGATKQVKSFSALIQAVKGVDDDFGIDHKEAAVYLQASGKLHPVEQKRDWRRTKSLHTVADCMAASVFFQRTLELWHPGMERFTGSISVAMQRQSANSGESAVALRKLLQTIWQTWCSSVGSIINVSRLSSRSSKYGYPMRDIAVHHRYHVQLLPPDFWNTLGKSQCIAVRNEAREEKVVQLQQANDDLAVRLAGIESRIGNTRQQQAPQQQQQGAAKPPGSKKARQQAKRQAAAAGAGAGARAGAKVTFTPAPAPAPAPAPGRNATPRGPDPVLGFTERKLSKAADVKAAIIAAGHQTLRDAQLAFAATDTTAHNAQGKGGCFWMKSDIGKIEGKCPYASKCAFQH